MIYIDHIDVYLMCSSQLKEFVNLVSPMHVLVWHLGGQMLWCSIPACGRNRREHVDGKVQVVGGFAQRQIHPGPLSRNGAISR